LDATVGKKLDTANLFTFFRQRGRLLPYGCHKLKIILYSRSVAIEGVLGCHIPQYLASSTCIADKTQGAIQ